MKEYLKRLARGSFVYEEPKMEVSDKELNLDVTIGTIGEFDFVIKASEVIKGIIWSSNERVIAKNNTFKGDVIKVSFKVNTAGLAVGDVINGVFDMVTNAGEAQVKYQVKIVQNVVKSTASDITNLFQFASLVQNAYEEAEVIFVSDGFRDIIADDTFENLYDLMRKSNNVAWEIEEFLIAAKNKQPITISVDKPYVRYDDFKESIQNSILLTKSGWGYVGIDVSTDCDFIRVAADRITREEFTGNDYELQYLLDSSLMHAGTNYGRIIFTTYNQKIEVVIEVVCSTVKAGANDTKKARLMLIREYLNYRMKKLDTAGWLAVSRDILERARANAPEDIFFKLAQAQLCIADNRNEESEWLLERVKAELSVADIEGDIKAVEIYSYYLYVNSLLLKDEAYTAKVFHRIKNYYENGYDSWKLLWMLFYLDKAYAKNISIKLLRLKEAFRDGCTSSVMYMEAIMVLNTQPSLLRVLNRFEMCVLDFGVKNGLILEKLAEQIAFLIHNEKVATLAMVKILIELEKKYKSDMILEILVTQLIRNEFTGKQYFKLYEKGILRGLRITQLYEYYIKSIDRSRYIRLPKIVLMYFTYESNLDAADKAYLYADILINEADNEDIMSAYRGPVERFGYEQLKENNISDNLLVIYRHIWSERFIDEDTQAFMLRLLFCYRVKCYGADVKNVLVKHQQLKTVEKYPVIDGTAYVSMYTDNCSIVLEGTDGVLRKDSITYEVEKAFDDETLAEELINRSSDDIYVRIYNYEHRTSQEMDDNCLLNVLVLLNSDSVEEKIKTQLNSWLIDYYSKYYVGDDFESCLSKINRHNLAVADAVKLIEVCIANDLFDDAYELIKKYGYSSVNSVSLLRLARNFIEEYNYEPKGVLTAVCYHIFYDKKYDEKVLKYLSLNFYGTNEQMYDIWSACQNFGVNAITVGENFLAQMLFMGQHNGRSTKVFNYYISNGGKRFVIHAYVAYHAYQYFVKHKRANEIVFEVIEAELLDEHDLPDICAIALLKHYSARPDELELQQLCLVENLIRRLSRENKIFEFYKKFKDKVMLPHTVIDKTVVEFYARPDSKVEIHYYTKENQETPVTEIMQGFEGVFTKSFTLFYGDAIEYYFTAENDNESVKTEMFNLVNKNINIEQTVGRFDYINDVLAGIEAHDIVTVRKIMHNYCVQDYIVNEIFKPM